jgi:hypothetical protein
MPNSFRRPIIVLPISFRVRLSARGRKQSRVQVSKNSHVDLQCIFGSCSGHLTDLSVVEMDGRDGRRRSDWLPQGELPEGKR